MSAILYPVQDLVLVFTITIGNFIIKHCENFLSTERDAFTDKSKYKEVEEEMILNYNYDSDNEKLFSSTILCYS